MPKCALCLPKCSQAIASAVRLQRFEHEKEKSEMDFGTWKAKINSEGGCVFLLGRLAWVERGQDCLAAKVQLLPLRGDSTQALLLTETWPRGAGMLQKEDNNQLG